MNHAQELIKFFTEEPDGVPQIIGTREDGWVRVERVEGTAPELADLKDGQRVGMGDGKTFHLCFTPISSEEMYKAPKELSLAELARMGRPELCRFAAKKRILFTQSLSEPLLSERDMRDIIMDTLKARGYKTI